MSHANLSRALLLLVALSATAQLVAQAGDSRAAALSGAMVSLGDDLNALQFNPAGLAFVRRATNVFSGDLGLTVARGAATAPVYPYLNKWQSGTDAPIYYYYDNFLMANRTFDFEPLRQDILALAATVSTYQGKAWADLTDEDKATLYNTLSQMHGSFDGLTGVRPVVLNSSATFGGPGWGIAAASGYKLQPVTAGYFGLDTTLSFAVEHTQAYVGGLGLQIGPLAVGGNLRYTRVSNYTRPVDFLALSGVSGVFQPADVAEFFHDDVDPNDPTTGVQTSSLVAGVGALFTLGTLNVGVYNDRALWLSTPAESGRNFLDTTSVGASFLPFDSKFGNKYALVFNATADVKNVGDDVNRALAAGGEVGLNLGDFLVAILRAGYSQPLPGPLDSAFVLTPEVGAVSFGGEARVWFLRADASVQVPVATLQTFAAQSGSLSESQRRERLATLRVTLSAAF